MRLAQLTPTAFDISRKHTRHSEMVRNRRKLFQNPTRYRLRTRTFDLKGYDHRHNGENHEYELEDGTQSGSHAGHHYGRVPIVLVTIFPLDMNISGDE
ncbi:Hypothetical protein CINCED_3A023859 [Cinara cedri]|uniref:Uncharacterized protein n=1 Tax=Cinara cedri TaxID=506608 RepID=A0A5E4NLH8_9HEMI|nr:Hypothetical protein CINCED_3A023859 [Cinara cedri]